jgi:hypothetical protein
MSNYAPISYNVKTGYAKTEFPATPADNSPPERTMYMQDPTKATLGCRARRVQADRDRRWKSWLSAEWRCGKPVADPKNGHCTHCMKNYTIWSAVPDYKKGPAWQGNYDEPTPAWCALFSSTGYYKYQGGPHADPEWQDGKVLDKQVRHNAPKTAGAGGPPPPSEPAPAPAPAPETPTLSVPEKPVQAPEIALYKQLLAASVTENSQLKIRVAELEAKLAHIHASSA